MAQAAKPNTTKLHLVEPLSDSEARYRAMLRLETNLNALVHASSIAHLLTTEEVSEVPEGFSKPTRNPEYVCITHSNRDIDRLLWAAGQVVTLADELRADFYRAVDAKVIPN